MLHQIRDLPRMGTGDLGKWVGLSDDEVVLDFSDVVFHFSFNCCPAKEKMISRSRSNLEQTEDLTELLGNLYLEACA